MKTINFNAVEVLPSLLDKSKTQTIRKAWKTYKGKSQPPLFQPNSTYRYKPEITEFLKPKVKVGDEIKLMWNEKSKAEWFDRTKGEGLDIKQIKPDFKCMCFNKLLGTATITEVFEIEMWKTIAGFRTITNGKIAYDESNKDLAKRDGFKSAEEMFKWFDKNYDLSKARRFYVYRWRWNK